MAETFNMYVSLGLGCLLTISEIFPFINKIQSNGITELLINTGKKILEKKKDSAEHQTLLPKPQEPDSQEPDPQEENVDEERPIKVNAKHNINTKYNINTKHTIDTNLIFEMLNKIYDKINNKDTDEDSFKSIV
jgi:LAS superfamily LD-carboxypeptidase LdcB